MLSVLFKLLKDCERFVNICQILTPMLTRWQSLWHDGRKNWRIRPLWGVPPTTPTYVTPPYRRPKWAFGARTVLRVKNFPKKFLGIFRKGLSHRAREAHNPSAQSTWLWLVSPNPNRSGQRGCDSWCSKPKCGEQRGCHQARESQRTCVAKKRIPSIFQDGTQMGTRELFSPV